MAEFLDSFDFERSSLLTALDHFETVWARFQERRALDLEDSGLSDSLIAGELALVRSELETTQFTVGLFGLIKRGKSTLLNALIGREVSAMHVTPETAVPVYVSYAQEPEAQVHFADGNTKYLAVEEVPNFTSQKHNANNHLGVTYVEQRVPVGFLRHGTRLIDTPGLDDAEADDVYTERTMQELDVVDAGIVVFLSPPTVGATEMGFLGDVVSRDLKKTFLVCNMYPQHFHDPDTRREVLNYVGGRIVEASRRAGKDGAVRVYPVCALEAWEARLEDDIDKWKRSGADRLLRDLELYLSGSAGRQVLLDSAERVEKAAEMAKAEVRVRQALLDDHAELETYRARVDDEVRELERQFDQAVEAALSDLSPLKMRIRSLLLSPFKQARERLEGLDSMQEVEDFATKFRREMEVSGELASRQFSDGFARLVRKVQEHLEDRLNAVMSDLSPNVPDLRLSTGGLLITQDQIRSLQKAHDRSKQSGRAGAVAGGVAGGGAAVAAAGATLLGPLGLLAGALVGWKVTSLVAGQRNLDRAKETVLERLDEVSQRLVSDFDAQVARAVETLRNAVQRRRRAFASDLYQQFDLVQRISEEPELLESYQRDAERFLTAFDACAARARRAVSEPEVATA
ncbi:MAG: dynamin family protein [Nitriliruptorales bacterium]|nr:dynamin family protein [Nitriliruptorales bacterium]